jgi:hypothetical protein
MKLKKMKKVLARFIRGAYKPARSTDELNGILEHDDN